MCPQVGSLHHLLHPTGSQKARKRTDGEPLWPRGQSCGCG
jgi:hypothetical protein